MEKHHNVHTTMKNFNKTGALTSAFRKSAGPSQLVRAFTDAVPCGAVALEITHDQRKIKQTCSQVLTSPTSKTCLPKDAFIRATCEMQAVPDLENTHIHLSAPQQGPIEPINSCMKHSSQGETKNQLLSFTSPLCTCCL